MAARLLGAALGRPGGADLAHQEDDEDARADQDPDLIGDVLVVQPVELPRSPGVVGRKGTVGVEEQAMEQRAQLAQAVVDPRVAQGVVAAQLP